ncbi:MAG: phosphatase PAP2 family protein [Bacteroidetes bacterium]|nr:phosphatase PAP2 family protein [Bacteroidota bacterium]
MKPLLLILLLAPFCCWAQTNDSLPQHKTLLNSPAPVRIMYSKPKPFSFITHIPKDVAGFAKTSFQKNNLPNLGIIVASTAVLYLSDQSITNTVQDKMEDNFILARENFKPMFRVNIGGKPTNIGKLPRNINTAFYDLGQGSSAMVLAAGFFIAGKISKDNRALNTACELTETFIALGVGTQMLKYATGRENPSDATTIRGKWQPFPSWKNFQNNKTRYDAFPSGHMATFVSAVTIIGENYPEKKWIKPLGYSIAGLCGLAMINNGVHWSSDFPLGFALGHGYGKYIARKNRKIIQTGEASMIN